MYKVNRIHFLILREYQNRLSFVGIAFRATVGISGTFSTWKAGGSAWCIRMKFILGVRSYSGKKP